jgi:hypothetical protein
MAPQPASNFGLSAAGCDLRLVANRTLRTPGLQPGFAPFYKGMLACFFFGFMSRLFSSARREVMMCRRVSAGSITPSR